MKIFFLIYHRESGAFVSGAFVSGAFVSGAFVSGAFVSGAFVSHTQNFEAICVVIFWNG
jgi:hypothetical protein